MATSTMLVDLLKKLLKRHGKSYRDVATALDISQTTVKRLFATGGFSLERVDAICSLIDLEISDLLAEMAAQATPLSMLSNSQEETIVADEVLMLVTVAALNRMTYDEMSARFSVAETDLVRRLAWLDRQKIITLLPKNRFQLHVSSNFAWRRNGPMQRFFQSKLAAEYFGADFAGSNERLLVLNGVLSERGQLEVQARLDRLALEFEAINREEAGLPLAMRRGFTLVLAHRPWTLDMFTRYLRPE